MNVIDRIRAMMGRQEKHQPNSENKREEREAAKQAIEAMSRGRTRR